MGMLLISASRRGRRVNSSRPSASEHPYVSHLGATRNRCHFYVGSLGNVEDSEIVS